MIPDSLPVISAGSHKSPAEGACAMEYVSMLAGEPFSDQPACTHRALARVAQVANDALPGGRRHEMFSRINRLFGTNTAQGEEAKRVSVGLARFAAAWAANSAFAASASGAARAAATSTAYTDSAAGAAGGALLVFLDALLDEYDRLTGRTQVEAVADRIASVACQVGTGS